MDDLVAGRYQLVRMLGRGGMGEVLLARQLDLDKLVVVKRADVRSQRNQRALVEEAKIAARLNHPNIVSVLEVIERPDQSIVVMEFVAGVTLRELIEDAPEGLPPEVALAIAVDVLRGLGYAHGVKRSDAIGVIHRDVKPRNLMVTFAGTTKLIDFGISRWLDDSGGWEATSISGTRGYMAPEQLEGSRVDGRADLYAVGITLREMLTGVPPACLPGEDDTGNARRGPRPIEDPFLAEIVARASAPLAKDRFPTCAEMISAIETYAGAANLALGVTGVERFMSTRFAGRKATLEGDADQRRPRPPTSTTIHEGARGSSPVALLGRIRLATRSSASEQFGPVCARLLRRHWLHAPVRRFFIVDAADAQRVDLACTQQAGTFRVEASIGSTVVSTGSGTSVIEAVDALGTALLAAASYLPEVEADPAELAAMRRLGTTSFGAYRDYRRALDEQMSNFIHDTRSLIPAVEDAIQADPGWAHAHGLLVTLYGKATPDGAAALATARATIDRTRDPIGARILEYVENSSVGTAALVDAFRVNPEDLLVGYYLVPALAIAQQLDDAAAVTRKLHADHPDSMFGTDLANLFTRGGRDSEAERMIREWAAARPENLGAVVELARIEAAAGNVTDAARLARSASAIHGDAADKLTLMFEAYVCADDLESAQGVADRMLLGSPLERARGRLRAAIVATLEGRFASAYSSIRRAVDENRAFGLQSEVLQCLAIAVSMAHLASDRGAVVRYATELADTEANLNEDLGMATCVRYDLAMVETAGRPPPVESQLGSLTDESVRDFARTGMLRSAALVGVVPASDAVAAGFSSNESSASSLLALGICARREREHAIARRALEKASRLWSPLLVTQASPYHAMLARYHLAGVLVALGHRDDARRHYEAFLRRWGTADRPIAEVAAAREELAAL